MSRSPLEKELGPDSPYLDYFGQLAERIRAGASFSGRERNCAFLNLGGRTFADASAALALDFEQDARGLSVCDWDGDGDLDLWLANRTAPKVQLLQNDGGGRSVSVLLEGNPSMGAPRDAAGARVVLKFSDEILTRTVHLGDGFVSQSSRWLVIGLGERELESCEVIWPGSGSERFEGVRAGGRFILKQGEGRAREKKGMTPPLSDREAVLLSTTDQAEIWLSRPLRLKKVDGIPRGPVFVNLWASWCQPCLNELEEFGQAEDLPFFFLNVDGGKGLDQVEMNALLKSKGLEEKGVVASDAMVESFNNVVLEAVYRHRNLPVPSTFLLDQDGRVRAIYKGPVPVDVLREDLGRVSADSERQKDASVPFPGRWSVGLFDTNPISVAKAYQEGGYFDDARAYLLKYVEQLRAEGVAGYSRLGELHLTLGRLERVAENRKAALLHLQKALELVPGQVGTRILLALTLAENGNADQAGLVVSELKKARPKEPNFLNLEAEVHEILGDDVAAAEGYRRTLAVNRRYIPAINALASLLATSNQGAVRNGEEALRLAKFLMTAPGAGDDADFVMTLAEAHAETGDFENAMLAIGKAEELLRKYGSQVEQTQVQSRRRAFSSGKAFRRESSN